MLNLEQQVAEALDLSKEECFAYSPPERLAIRDFIRLRAPMIAIAIQTGARMRCKECGSYPDVCKRYGCARIKTPDGRRMLSKQLKEQFESLKEECDRHRICVKCWEPLPLHSNICYCDNDE